jgi:hypothetical protein
MMRKDTCLYASSNFMTAEVMYRDDRGVWFCWF